MSNKFRLFRKNCVTPYVLGIKGTNLSCLQNCTLVIDQTCWFVEQKGITQNHGWGNQYVQGREWKIMFSQQGILSWPLLTVIVATWGILSLEFHHVQSPTFAGAFQLVAIDPMIFDFGFWLLQWYEKLISWNSEPYRDTSKKEMKYIQW